MWSIVCISQSTVCLAKRPVYRRDDRFPEQMLPERHVMPRQAAIQSNHAPDFVWQSPLEHSLNGRSSDQARPWIPVLGLLLDARISDSAMNEF